jgi:hypothetical protein
VIMDVEATTAIRQAEVGAARAAKTMLDRTAEHEETNVYVCPGGMELPSRAMA